MFTTKRPLLRMSAILIGHLATTIAAFGFYDEDKASCLKTPDINVCSRAIAETPGWFSDTVVLYEARGKAYLAKSEFSNAVADFSEFLKLAPRNQSMDLFVRSRVLRSRAEAYRATKRYNLAIEDYAEVLKIHASASAEIYDFDKVFLCELRAESQRELPPSLAAAARCSSTTTAATTADRCTDELLKQTADLASFSKMAGMNNCATAEGRAIYDREVSLLKILTERHKILISICPESNFRWQYARDTFEVQSRVFQRISKGCGG